VCVTLHWLDCSKSIVEKYDQYYRIMNAIVAIIAIIAIAFPTALPIGTVQAEIVFGSLHSGVCVRSQSNRR
jgi:uncharacterized membrane protein